MAIFKDPEWQMNLGERAALDGLLAELRPSLSCAIGGTESVSVSRLAMHCGEVHVFDRVGIAQSLPDGVIRHEGDFQVACEAALSQFAAARRNLDFVLIEGLHSSTVVRENVERLLESPAVLNTYILVRDATNETVRNGLELVRYGAWSKVAFVDHDFVPGYMFRDESIQNEMWGGLSLIVVDASNFNRDIAVGPASDTRRYSVSLLYERARESLESVEQSDGRPQVMTDDGRTINLMREIASLEEEIAHMIDAAVFHENIWRSMQDSASWRITTPLRALAARARR